MKNIYSFIIGILLFVNANAQTPQLSWTKSHNVSGSSYDYSSFMKIYNFDNSVYTLASTDAFGTGNDILLIKRNSSGDTLWTRRFNGSANGDDQPTGLVIDQTFGNVYLTGKTTSSSNGLDIVTQRYSPVGFLFYTKIWNNLDYNGDDFSSGIDIDGSNNVYVCGTTFNGTSNKEDIILLVYNDFGNSIANDNYGFHSNSNWTGTPYNIRNSFGTLFENSRDFSKHIKVTTGGTCFIGGEWMYGNQTSGVSLSFVIKLEYNSFDFVRTYSNSCTNSLLSSSYPFGTFYVNNDFNYQTALTCDNSGNSYFAALIDTISNSSVYYKLAIGKLNSNGCLSWDKQTGGNSNPNNLRINSIKVDGTNGNVYVVGFETNGSGNKDILIIKYNSSGVEQWRITKNGSGNGDDIGYDLAFDSQLNPLITGKTRGSNSLDNIAIIKFDKNNGSEIFNMSNNPNNQHQTPQNILLDGFNNIYVNGWHNTSSQNANILTTKFCSGSVIADAGIDTALCSGNAVQLNATGGGTYLWTPSVGLSSTTISNPLANPNSTTKYYLQVTSNGCQATDSLMVFVRPKPKTGFTVNDSIQCLTGNSFIFSDTSIISSGTLTRLWSFGDLTTSTNQNITKSYNSSNTYTVKLLGTSNFGCKDSVIKTVIIDAQPTATATPQSLTNICQGSSVVLSANIGTTFSYKWQKNSIDIANATNQEYTANATGNYTVIVFNSKGCSDTSNAINVTVNPLPLASISTTSTTNFCQGGSALLNANTGTNLTYQWKNNGVNILNANSSTFNATSNGIFKVVVSNSFGCSDSSNSINVVVFPKPNTSAISGNANVQPSSTQSYNVNNAINSGFNWIVNNGTIISGLNTNAITVQWNSSTGIGFVKVIETFNTTGCKGDTIALNVTISNFTLNVNPLNWNFQNTAGSKSFALTSNTNWNVTTNQPTWISLNKTSGNGNDNINVSVSANTSATSRIATVTFTAGSLTQVVTIMQDSTPISPDQLSLNKDTIRVNPSQTSTVIQLQSNRSWTITNPASWITFSPMSGTNNQILSVNIQANSGTPRTADIIVTAGLTNKFLHISQDGITGVNEVKNIKNISVYPNPSTGLFTIDFNNIVGSKTISVFDITGKVIKTTQTENYEFQLNIEGFDKGIYLLNIQTIQGIVNSKLVLE